MSQDQLKKQVVPMQEGGVELKLEPIRRPDVSKSERRYVCPGCGREDCPLAAMLRFLTNE